MRILHLVDGSAPRISAPALAVLEATLGRLGAIEERVVLAGGRRLAAEAERAGIAPWRTLATPREFGPWAWPGLRRRLGGFTPDLVHCWTPGALSLAALALPRTPRLLTLSTPASPRTRHWLRSVATAAPAATGFLATSATLRHQLVTAGLDPERVAVARPGLEMGRLDRSARDRLRSERGVGEATWLLAFLADPPALAEANGAFLAVSLCASSRKPAAELNLLVHPEAAHRRRAATHARHLGHPDRLRAEPLLAAPWQILPACDAVIASGAHVGPTLLWAMAAGLPIVGEATTAVGELLEDRHSALLAPPGQTRMLAHRLNRLMEDPQLAWKLRDTVRHEAYSFFSRRAACETATVLYGQMLEGAPLDPPPLPASGGLRFEGRG